MPFPFSHVCDLLTALEALYTTQPPLPSSTLYQKQSSYIDSWFAAYREEITSEDPKTITGLLSILLPELRWDRVYGFREKGLARTIAKSLYLGPGRKDILISWRESKECELAVVVEKVMKQTDDPTQENKVGIEEIEDALNRLAGRCRFSSEALRKEMKGERTQSAEEIWGGLWRRMSSLEGKWLTRVVLKSLCPVKMPETNVLAAYHFLLPHLFSFQNDLGRACILICSPEFREIPHNPYNRADTERFLALSSRLLKPEVGIKVGRPEFIKARSCKHAAILASRRKFSMERKYDGEYCQIHIDLSRGDMADGWLKIFSKSGRDSTRDRYRVHRTIRDALKIDSSTRRGFKIKCIFEAELVVYSTRENRIMEFHHLRSHVNRAGTYIGNTGLQRDPFSHLMLLVFDCLLVDSLSLLHLPYSKRRKYLHQIIPDPIRGKCEFAERRVIDFGLGDKAVKEIRELFAMGIIKRWEGFVLKPYNGAYLDLSRRKGGRGEGFVGGKEAWIKLKKDYIEGLGDTADFCVIGGSVDSSRSGALKLKPGMLSVFHIGCLINKEDVRKSAVKPKFMVAFDVAYSISKLDLEWINRLASFGTVPFKAGKQIEQFDLEFSGSCEVSNIQYLFPKPFVFEIIGGGFHKQSGCTFYTPRHPRVAKIHWDRDYIEAVGLEELQALAEEAVNFPEEFESQEERDWVKRIILGEFGKREVRNMGRSFEAVIEKVAGTYTRQRSLSMLETPAITSTATLATGKSSSVVDGIIAKGNVAGVIREEIGVLKEIDGTPNMPGKRSFENAASGTPTPVKKLRAEYHGNFVGVTPEKHSVESAYTEVTPTASSEETPTPLKKLRAEFQRRDMFAMAKKVSFGVSTRKQSLESTCMEFTPTAISEETPTPLRKLQTGYQRENSESLMTPPSSSPTRKPTSSASKGKEREFTYSPIRPALVPKQDEGVSLSPLINAEVYLEQSLSKFLELWEWLGKHDVGSIEPFDVQKFMPTATTNFNERGKKRIVIVEGQKPKRMRKVVASLVELKNRRQEMREKMGARAEEEDVWVVYDWRVCRHFQDEREEGVDWNLWRVWTV